MRDTFRNRIFSNHISERIDIKSDFFVRNLYFFLHISDIICNFAAEIQNHHNNKSSGYSMSCPLDCSLVHCTLSLYTLFDFLAYGTIISCP